MTLEFPYDLETNYPTFMLNGLYHLSKIKSDLISWTKKNIKRLEHDLEYYPVDSTGYISTKMFIGCWYSFLKVLEGN